MFEVKRYLLLVLPLTVMGCGDQAPTTQGQADQRATRAAPAMPDGEATSAPGTAASGRELSGEPKRAPTGKRASRLGKRALDASDREERIDALRDLAKLRNTEDSAYVTEVVEQALTDADPQIRREAARLVTDYPLGLDAARRSELAQNEPDFDVRAQLWVSVAEDRDVEEVRTHLSDALQDPDPRLRRFAQRYLDNLDHTYRAVLQRQAQQLKENQK